MPPAGRGRVPCTPCRGVGDWDEARCDVGDAGQRGPGQVVVMQDVGRRLDHQQGRGDRLGPIVPGVATDRGDFVQVDAQVAVQRHGAQREARGQVERNRRRPRRHGCVHQILKFEQRRGVPGHRTGGDAGDGTQTIARDTETGEVVSDHGVSLVLPLSREGMVASEVRCSRDAGRMWPVSGNSWLIWGKLALQAWFQRPVPCNTPCSSA